MKEASDALSRQSDHNAESLPGDLPVAGIHVEDREIMDVIEGGDASVSNILDGGDVTSSPPKSFEVHDREKQRGALTTKLFWAFVVLIGAQYICTLVLVLAGKAEVRMLDSLFTSTLPVLTGFLGSAITFYFKER